MNQVERGSRTESGEREARLGLFESSNASPIAVIAEGSVRYSRAIPTIAMIPTIATIPTIAPNAPVPDADVPGDIGVRRRLWPWLAGAAVLVGAGAGGYALHAQRQARAAFADRYPIVATDYEAATLEREAARWSRGKQQLLATLARFDAPPIETMVGVGACALPIDAPHATTTGREATRNDAGQHPASAADPDRVVSTRLIVLPQESLANLDALARPELEVMLAAAARGRFQTEHGRDQVVRALGGAFVVVKLAQQRDPQPSTDASAFTPGVAAGTAYAFDPATGDLRCAGTFRATSSAAAGAAAGGHGDAPDAMVRDWEAQTDHAIASSLRAID